MTRNAIDPEQVADVIARVRVQAPRVHVITNSVAQPFTANMLLAAGAVPSMTHAPEEVAEFAASAGALVANLGTLDKTRRHGIEIAVEIAKETGIPVILDPVMIDVSKRRRDFAVEIGRVRPSVLRGNQGEIASFARALDLAETPQALAVALRTVVVVTGETDFVTDGHVERRVGNGHPLLARVTATGCAGSGLTAACRAVEPDPVAASVAALVWMGLAAERAGRTAPWPGGFASALIDQVAALGKADILLAARLEALS